jgi:ATP-dependent Clp protease protease subunit
MVIEKSSRGNVSYDIYSRLLRDRIIFLCGSITEELASIVIAQMLYLHINDPNDTIQLYIMSDGGDVNAGLAIYDTMQFIPNDIATYCIGQACSMAAFLVASGTEGKRVALPSARLMIHQPWSTVSGDAREIEIQATELKRIKELLYDRLALHTHKKRSQIENDCDRDCFLSATEAQKYGLIDKVISRKDNKNGKKPAHQCRGISC